MEKETHTKKLFGKPNGFPVQQPDTSTPQNMKKSLKNPHGLSGYQNSFWTLCSKISESSQICPLPRCQKVSFWLAEIILLLLICSSLPPFLYPLIISVKFSNFLLATIWVKLMISYCKTNQNVWWGINYIRKALKIKKKLCKVQQEL